MYKMSERVDMTCEYNCWARHYIVLCYSLTLYSLPVSCENYLRVIEVIKYFSFSRWRLSTMIAISGLLRFYAFQCYDFQFYAFQFYAFQFYAFMVEEDRGVNAKLFLYSTAHSTTLLTPLNMLLLSWFILVISKHENVKHTCTVWTELDGCSYMYVHVCMDRERVELLLCECLSCQSKVTSLSFKLFHLFKAPWPLLLSSFIGWKLATCVDISMSVLSMK